MLAAAVLRRELLRHSGNSSVVLAAAGSLGMPPNHNPCAPAASSNGPDLQHAPAAGGGAALDPLPWLVIESGQECSHDNGWTGVSSSPSAREPDQPLRPLRPAEAIAVPTEPGMQLVCSQLTSPAHQQDLAISQDVPHKEHEAQQSDTIHQAEQPAAHAAVYGPVPEGVEGPMQLQQVLTYPWRDIQMQLTLP